MRRHCPGWKHDASKTLAGGGGEGVSHPSQLFGEQGWERVCRKPLLVDEHEGHGSWLQVKLTLQTNAAAGYGTVSEAVEGVKQTALWIDNADALSRHYS